jgi:hypothetical protein
MNCCRFAAVALAFFGVAACRGTDAYWRGDPARDAEAANARGEYGPIALRDGDKLVLPGWPDSLREVNMDFGRLDSLTLGRVGAAQRDSVIKYVAAYNTPIFQAILRHIAAHPKPPR